MKVDEVINISSHVQPDQVDQGEAEQEELYELNLRLSESEDEA